MPEAEQIIADMLRDVGARAQHHTHVEIAYLIRAGLRTAGFVIVPSTTSLIEKGKDVKLHD